MFNAKNQIDIDRRFIKAFEDYKEQKRYFWLYLELSDFTEESCIMALDLLLEYFIINKEELEEFYILR